MNPRACLLPFAHGLTPQSSHTSYLGAKAAEVRAPNQSARYVALLLAWPEGLTDLEAARLLQLERTSICARRSLLVKTGIVVPNGFRKSPAGVKNVLWRIRP